MNRFLQALKAIPANAAALVRLHYFRPMHLFLALGIAIVLYEVIFWALNAELGLYLLLSPDIPLIDKTEIIIASLTQAYAYPINSSALLLLIIALSQGFAISTIIFMIRQEKSRLKDVKKHIGVTGASSGLAALGLGCAACGTSLVTPLLVLAFGNVSVGFVQSIGFYAMLLGAVLSVVSLLFVSRQLMRYSFRKD